MNQRAQQLRVGGRYRAGGGFFIRTIVALEGDVVCYVDQAGAGRCSTVEFSTSFVPVEDVTAVTHVTHDATSVNETEPQANR